MEDISTLGNALPQLFPDKILIRIFENLNAEDLKAASLVCKTWFEASAQPHFLKRFCINIFTAKRRAKDVKASKITSSLGLFTNSTRNFPNFYCQKIKLNGTDAATMWSKIGGHVEHLVLYKCEISSKTLVKFLKAAPKLTNLELIKLEQEQVKSWRLSDFAELRYKTNIRHLRWVDGLIIGDDLFNALIPITSPSKLESFSLGDVKLNDNEERMANTQKQFLFFDGDGTLREPSFTEFLQIYHKNLKSLEIVDTHEEKIVRTLVKTRLPLQLEKLEIKRFITRLVPCVFAKFLTKLTTLKEFSLVEVVVGDNILTPGVAKMKNLEKFTIKHIETAEQIGSLKMLQHLQNLKVLTLDNLKKMAATGFQVMVEMNLVHLQELTLNEIHNFRAADFVKIIPKMPNLKLLSTHKCSKLMSDEVIHGIFQYLVNLEVLSLGDLKQITENAFIKEDAGLQNLRKLKQILLDCPALTNKCLQTVVGLLELKKVELINCTMITGGGVKFLIAQCPALRDLWISPRKMPTAQVKDVMDYADSNMKRFRSVRL